MKKFRKIFGGALLFFTIPLYIILILAVITEFIKWGKVGWEGITVLIFGFFFCIIIPYGIFDTEGAEKRYNEKKLKEEIERRSEEKRQKQKEMFLNQIKEKYGQEMIKNIESSNLVIGMPENALSLCLGKDPDDVKESITKKTKTSKYYYGKSVSKRGNVKYQREVTVSNGLVAGWKDL
jgi:apolipoprotein N-acyltransferase